VRKYKKRKDYWVDGSRHHTLACYGYSLEHDGDVLRGVRSYAWIVRVVRLTAGVGWARHFFNISSEKIEGAVENL
jgi:hypothetical protein